MAAEVNGNYVQVGNVKISADLYKSHEYKEDRFGYNNYLTLKDGSVFSYKNGDTVDGKPAIIQSDNKGGVVVENFRFLNDSVVGYKGTDGDDFVTFKNSDASIRTGNGSDVVILENSYARIHMTDEDKSERIKYKDSKLCLDNTNVGSDSFMILEGTGDISQCLEKILPKMEGKAKSWF